MDKKQKSPKKILTLIGIFILTMGLTLGVIFLIKNLTSENNKEETSEVLEPEPETPAEEEIKYATLSFTGDVSLADNWWIMPNYDKNGGISAILGEKMLKTMRETDFMVVNSEFTVSNRGTALSGKMYTFRAKPERLKIYDEMGVDMVTLANNHVYDYGKDAFLDMLEAFEEYKIPHIGAGRNLKEASEAYITEINGYKFAFISASRAEKNIYTPGATESTPGIFWCYDPTNVINKIKELRADESIDFIIPIVHFGRENSHELETVQVESAKKYIDAGADLIVGHHAHVLQGVEFYNGKPIIYNLGNFLFNPETIDTALFQIKLSSKGEMEYYLLPALQKDSPTELLEGSEKQRVIDELNSWSINAVITEDGKIEEKTGAL